MRRVLLLLLIFELIILNLVHAQVAYQSQVWSPDNGDGTYRNPVLYADYSDPDVCAVGEDYYLTASSFNCVPGLPILHSRDLVNWQIIGHALTEMLPTDVFDKPQHGFGVWAPSIRHHKDSLYIYWGDPDRGIFMVKAPLSEKGELGSEKWSRPICVIEGRGMIDPCPLWDEDGRCYLVNGWAKSRAGFNSVLTVRELSTDGTRAIGLPRIVFDGGQENHTAEGPKMYKRDGWYWILCPAGGVEQGWQLAMRSHSPYGPYEWKRVMWQGRTVVNGPHQGAWVHTVQNEDWFLHFNDKGALGRVVMLQPVDWTSGWPMMGNNGKPLLLGKKPQSSSNARCNPQESDDFTNGVGLQWQWHANYNQFHGMPTADGWMRLYTRHQQGSLWNAPNLFLQKISAPQFTATAHIRLTAKADGQWGGLLMMGRDYSGLVVRREDNQFVLQRRTCQGADEGKVESQTLVVKLAPTSIDTVQYAPAIHLDLYLRLTVSDGTCDFSYSLDGRKYEKAGDKFTMKSGKWIGAKYGFVAESEHEDSDRGWLDIDWVKVEPIVTTDTPFDVNQQLKYCHQQLKRALKSITPNDYKRMPRNIPVGQPDWNHRDAVAEEWCSGFWPGILWMDYAATGDQQMRELAREYTKALHPLVYQPVYDHDLGFIVLGSFGKGELYDKMVVSEYRPVMLAAADSLTTLFNPRAGTLLSWPRQVKDFGGHNTIVDNMMNLELLLWAAENGGNKWLREVAIKHAETTMKNHFRPDGSSYHVAVYDTISGKFIRAFTHQGYSDSSMWSRGQSWAIYGYTMLYSYTREREFLDFAQKVADIYLKRLQTTSDDWVPLWDMDDPRGLGAPKDASAACVAASALLELSKYAGRNKGREYRDAAVAMLTDLSTARYQSRERNVAFLMHSTDNHPAGSEIDCSLVYADYYYLEALLRLKDQSK